MDASLELRVSVAARLDGGLATPELDDEADRSSTVLGLRRESGTTRELEETLEGRSGRPGAVNRVEEVSGTTGAGVAAAGLRSAVPAFLGVTRELREYGVPATGAAWVRAIMDAGLTGGSLGRVARVTASSLLRCSRRSRRTLCDFENAVSRTVARGISPRVALATRSTPMPLLMIVLLFPTMMLFTTVESL